MALDHTRFAIFVLLAVTLLVARANGNGVSYATDPRAVVGEMLKQGHSYDVEALRSLGEEPLVALLDFLLPYGAPGAPDEDGVAQVLARLEDADAAVRESAQRELLDDPRYARVVALGLRHSVPEVRSRCFSVHRAWMKFGDLNLNLLPSVLNRYMERPLSSAEARGVAVRLRRALARGIPETFGTSLCYPFLHALAESADDETLGLLLPLVDHESEEVGALVVSGLGQPRRQHGRYAPVILRGLKSSKPKVICAAMDCGHSPEWPVAKIKQVRAELVRLFNGTDAALRESASFYLMWGFGDPAAAQFMIAQLSTSDRDRLFTFACWLGDSRNFGREPWPNLLPALTPLLSSKDEELARTAAGSIAVYAGPDVARVMIPLLTHDNAQIREAAERNLLQQDDREMVRYELVAASRDAAPLLRETIATILDKIPATR